MTTHTVVIGDCVASIAAVHGLYWETVWNHPANAGLRERRKDPNVLAPGDQLVIPDKRVKPFVRASGARHRFTLRGIPTMLELTLSWGDEPRAGEPFELNVDGQTSTGRTDAAGLLRAPLPRGAKQGVLVVGEGTRRAEYHLNLGALDPADSVSGALQRLRSLAFYAGADATAWNDEGQGALRAFQAAHDLPVNGNYDAATQARLRQVHDGH